jgi:hypothetical protein
MRSISPLPFWTKQFFSVILLPVGLFCQSIFTPPIIPITSDVFPEIPLEQSIVQNQDFPSFVDSVKDENRAELATGLYANEGWHFEIVEPEEGADPADLPYMFGKVLHFSYADDTGSLGLVAHDMPGGGARFYELA